MNKGSQIDFEYASYLNNSENFWKCKRLNYYDISNYKARIKDIMIIVQILQFLKLKM